MGGPIRKSIRFEVFKRDSFTCQYCGRKAPEVLLQVDHIEPRAKGGKDCILNLITACKDCNLGKSDKRLSDCTVINKQRSQLEELQERREQIEMMFEWQKGLSELQDEVVEKLQDIWEQHVTGYRLNESGKRTLKRLAKAYPVDEIIHAIRTAADQYLVFDGTEPTQSSAERAWKMIGGICRINRLEHENPEIKRLYYIRGILRNRLSYCNDRQAMALLREAFELDVSISELEELAKTARNWTEWRSKMEDYIAQGAPDNSEQSG